MKAGKKVCKKGSKPIMRVCAASKAGKQENKLPECLELRSRRREGQMQENNNLNATQAI